MSTDPRLAALRGDLAESRRALAEALAAVPADRRTERPAPDRWSAAEVLEHCARVEKGSTMLVEQIAAEAPARADHPADESSAWLISRARMENRSVRIPAPEFLHPTGGADADATWARLEKARAGLLAVLDGCEGRALEGATRPHPVLGPLNGYQWISAVAGHEHRHALQVREIAEALAVADGKGVA